MTAYPLWVLAGIVAAVLVARWQPDDAPELAPHRSILALAAALGAAAGAFLLELPAELCGWSWAPGNPLDGVVALGGRTVLGGLLGGWMAVEACKRWRGIRAATGDAFAAPLAVSLALGRLGCVSAGCCAGRICTPGWWASLDASGHPRLATAQAEAVFHVLAFAVLVLAQHRRWLQGSRLALYLAAYATFRFAIEFARPHPAMLGGLSWYQCLALVLLLVAGVTAWRRIACRPAAT